MARGLQTTRGEIPDPDNRRGVEATAERRLTITNKVGLHARPAALFVQTAARFKDTRVEVVKDGMVRDAKSILSVLTLGVGQGTTITVRAEGPQADAAGVSLADPAGLACPSSD